MNNQRVYIVDAKRTAIGKFLGALYEKDPADVCSQLITKGFRKELISKVELTVVGNVISAGTGQGIARKIAIQSGVPEQSPAYSVNMVCGSGMQAIRNGINEIKCGLDLVLCGGFEFMSNIPFATDSYIRLGKKFGDFRMVDLMTHDGLLDSFSGVHMGVTAENIAKSLKITRKEQDEYAYLSQQRAIAAVDSGAFNDEIVPVSLVDYKGNQYEFAVDEFPNRKSTLEKLATLKPTFIKSSEGTVTAGNTSGINDGASFVLLASQKFCDENHIAPMAEVIDTAFVGCDPQKMGLGPFFAIEKLLANTNIDFNKVDFLEINEAFAAQVLGCYKLLSQQYNVEMKTILEKTNLRGSGLGLGHPLGATGARIVTTLVHMMKNKSGLYGIASLCIGGGMGSAILVRSI